MYRRKATAIAAQRENPFRLAVASAVNFLMLLADFMYGTPERVQLTCRFAIGLAVLGAALSMYDINLTLSCTN